MAIGNKRSVLRQAAMLVAFGADGTRNATCPVCGHEIGKSFTLTAGEFSQTIDDNTLTGLDVAHIQAEMFGGSFELVNTFPTHKLCNMAQTVLNLDIFCAKFQTAWSASEIRTRAAVAQSLGDEQIIRLKKKMTLNSTVATVALSLYDASKDYRNRTPVSVTDLCRASI